MTEPPLSPEDADRETHRDPRLDAPTLAVPASDVGPIEPFVLGEPALPATIGRYRIDGVLGRGGMGIVYSAFDPELGRRVALKVMSHDLVRRPDAVQRFVAEVHVTAQLQHPAIVPVYDVGRTPEGDVFFTMRLIAGRTFAELTGELLAPAPVDPHPGSERPWTLFRALHAFVQACRAVAYAHEKGVIHRDLKPANVMVGRHGEVHVLDWGLAKLLSRDEPEAPPEKETSGDGVSASGAVTSADEVLGTPWYMAPEQATGDQPLGPAADVYALGATLYALLVGKAPHEGTTNEVFTKLARRTMPAPPSEVRPGLPRELDAISARALTHDLRARTPSVDALADEVEAFLEGRPLASQATRPEDAEFLRNYRSSDFRRPSVTVDVVVVAPGEGGWRILLQRRAKPPYAGTWALPGCFIRMEETLEDAARRVLDAETGLAATSLEELGTFADPFRDPRTRVITIAWLARTTGELEPRPGDGPLAWFEVRGGVLHGVELAFDHAKIVAAALRRLAPT